MSWFIYFSSTFSAVWANSHRSSYDQDALIVSLLIPLMFQRRSWWLHCIQRFLFLQLHRMPPRDVPLERAHLHSLVLAEATSEGPLPRVGSLVALQPHIVYEIPRAETTRLQFQVLIALHFEVLIVGYFELLIILHFEVLIFLANFEVLIAGPLGRGKQVGRPTTYDRRGHCLKEEEKSSWRWQFSKTQNTTRTQKKTHSKMYEKLA